MRETFLFYDIETTGLNKSFDQILEFAAIRTDASFRELERQAIKIRLRPDVIPQPEALITHRISIGAARSGVCEYDAVTRIHRMFNAPRTISIGYNSLGFDDEFLRFAFYRNLLPPYRHQYENGCSRMDVYPMTLIYWLFHRDGIQWPEVDGKPSLKLETLNHANQLTTGRAHDAMSDVEATLALAKRLRRAPEVWDYLAGNFDKVADRGRIESISAASELCIGRFRMGLLVDGRFGFERRCLVPALDIGPSIAYANQQLWLRLDSAELTRTTAESIAETTRAVRKRFGEPPIVLPPKERFFLQTPPECRIVMEENLNWIAGNPELFRAVIRYHQEYRYPDVPDVDADSALYLNKFMSRSQERLCKRFHSAGSSEKIDLLTLFEDKILRELAVRLLWRNFPEIFPATLEKEISGFLRRVDPATIDAAMVDFKGERRATPVFVRAEISRLRAERDLDPEQEMLLSELEGYLSGRFSQTG